MIQQEYLALDRPSAEPLPDLVLRLIGYLSAFARGPGNCRSAGEIADYLQIQGAQPARKVRQLISLYLSQFPFPVVGLPGHGFFVTFDPAEMGHYARTLHALLRADAARLAAFHRLASRCGYRRIASGPRTAYAPVSVPTKAD